MATRYVPINQGKLASDAKNANYRLKREDDLSVSNRLEKNGIPHSSIYRALETASKHGSEYDLDAYECAIPGLMGLAQLKMICDIFELEAKDYMLLKKKVKEEVKEEPQEETKELPVVDDEKLDELIVAINKIGNVLSQSMEYQKMMIDYLEQIKGNGRETMIQMQTLNAKYNKPSAYRR